MLLAIFQVLFAIVDESGNALVQSSLGAGIVNLEMNELEEVFCSCRTFKAWNSDDV